MGVFGAHNMKRNLRLPIAAAITAVVIAWVQEDCSADGNRTDNLRENAVETLLRASSASNMINLMDYVATASAQPLSRHIERFWFLSDAPPRRRERIVPSGTIELVFNLDEDQIRIYDTKSPARCRRFSGAIFSGAYLCCSQNRLPCGSGY
jgi:hypothetical protein